MSTRKSLSRSAREEVKARYNFECACCGSKRNLEIHHVVPIALGGSDRITNLILLCQTCHQAAHDGRHIKEHTRDTATKLGGRKRICSEDVFDTAFEKFVNGEIGKAKFRELTGYKSAAITDPGRCPFFREAMKRRGIANIRNNLDIAMTNRSTSWSGNLKEGAVVGYIEYTDGRKEDILYHDTGENDVGYTHRKHMAS